ncbi:MAG: hypothetical protein GX442_10055 [Candidatus Riflebacteria bacterium]|nr:hypothetical protein [Candidatus Riflebacteria bacterium]
MNRTVCHWLLALIIATPFIGSPTAALGQDLRGTWSLVANGHAGKLVIEDQEGPSFSGRFLFPQYGYDQPLIDGRIEGNTVVFTRDIPQVQVHSGVLSASGEGSMSMVGTFTQSGSGAYSWNATFEKRLDEEAELTAAPTKDPGETALARTSSVIFLNYPDAWKDTEMAGSPMLRATARFSEPPQSSTGFTLENPHVVTRVTTFHWYGGNGANPGSIQIVKMGGGYDKTWAAEGKRDPTKSTTFYWVIEPNVTLAPGTYYVNAIPKATWSFNKRSNLCGIAKVEGYPGTDADGGVPKTIVREFPITPGTPVSGTIDAERLIHKYSFRAEAGQRITISVEAAKALGVHADLFSPKKKRLGGITARATLKLPGKSFPVTSGGVFEVQIWVKNSDLKTGAYRLGIEVR